MIKRSLLAFGMITVIYFSCDIFLRLILEIVNFIKPIDVVILAKILKYTRIGILIFASYITNKFLRKLGED